MLRCRRVWRQPSPATTTRQATDAVLDVPILRAVGDELVELPLLVLQLTLVDRELFQKTARPRDAKSRPDWQAESASQRDQHAFGQESRR